MLHLLSITYAETEGILRGFPWKAAGRATPHSHNRCRPQCSCTQSDFFLDRGGNQNRTKSMFVKGKGCSVNLLHHLQGLQHHLPGVGTWTTLLGHLLGSCDSVKPRPGALGNWSSFSVIPGEINARGLMNCQLLFFI